MSIELGLKLTEAGLAEFAAAIAEARQVDITQMVLGDANGAWYETTGEEVELLGEQCRIPLLEITRASGHANRLVCDAPFPPEEGGFTLRNFGLLSSAGVLLAIGMHQVIELPAPGELTTIDIVIRGLLDVTNATVVNMVVDPYIVTATRAYVDTALTAHNTPASEIATGHVLLASVLEALAGVNSSKAVTPEGLKAAIDAFQAWLIGATPAVVNQISEIAAAIGNDPNFATTLATLLAAKATQTELIARTRGRYFYSQI